MAKLKTGRHTSSIKEIKKSKKRKIINTAIKNKIKTLTKKIKTSVNNDDIKISKERLELLFSELDKAAKKNILHRNAAANQKAKLSKFINKKNTTRS
ncbi:MAG: 30S ribosomal protein S20 [Endomicrobium sp.]|jgi:small subunit ribosomal protein S20|nr:30S ribosomal protein S20 [Endomicrobium sp.]